MQAIPGIDPADQEFFQQTFWGLTNYFDSVSIPSSADRASQTVAPASEKLPVTTQRPSGLTAVDRASWQGLRITGFGVPACHTVAWSNWATAITLPSRLPYRGSDGASALPVPFRRPDQLAAGGLTD